MEHYTNWQEEMRSAHLYQIMAQHDNNILHKKLFIDLKAAAEKQAEAWKNKIIQDGQQPPTAYEPDFRTRLVANLIKVFGTENIHSILSAMKIRGMSVFTHYHSEHRHTNFSSANNIRAAIFGINDGLISNLSLILGVVGAQASEHYILVTGVAGLLAGACSMGAGEYISVRSQREVFEYQIAIEKQELEEYPEEEIEELTLIYEARGVPATEANKLARLMIENPDTGLNALARDELGLNPEDMVSPTGAMLASFFSFGIGAAIPLMPFLFLNSEFNIYYSIAATGITLFTVGALLSLFTNRHPILLGLRMLCIGALAGCITYFIGRLFT